MAKAEDELQNYLCETCPGISQWPAIYECAVPPPVRTRRQAAAKSHRLFYLDVYTCPKVRDYLLLLLHSLTFDNQASAGCPPKCIWGMSVAYGCVTTQLTRRIQYYVRSTRYALPAMFDALVRGSDPDRMKGALYVLYGKGTGMYDSTGSRFLRLTSTFSYVCFLR